MLGLKSCKLSRKSRGAVARIRHRVRFPNNRHCRICTIVVFVKQFLRRLAVDCYVMQYGLRTKTGWKFCVVGVWHKSVSLPGLLRCGVETCYLFDSTFFFVEKSILFEINTRLEEQMKKKLLLLIVLAAVLSTCVFVSFGCKTTEPAKTTYVVTFDLDGGQMAQNTLTVTEGEVVDLSLYVPQKEDYKFVGWQCDGKDVTSVTVTDNVTVVAVWKEKLSVSCNVGMVQVVNGVVTFEATATPADEAKLTVTFNGNDIVADESGLYTVTLVKGTNIFYAYAVCGNDETDITYEIGYEGFSIVTDLYDLTTGDSFYTFGASALYGEEPAESVIVEIDGKEVEGNDGKYTLSFTESKSYVVTIKAVFENKQYTETYIVTYDASLPKFAQMTLATDKAYRGETVAFTLTATDENGTKLDDKDVAFYADFDIDDNSNEFTALTSSEISTVWSDSNATSYRLFVNNGGFANGLNKTALLKVVLTSGDKTVERLYRICYVGPDADGCIGEIVVSIDGFTVGAGYILEPTIVKVYNGVKFPNNLAELIENNGWTMEYTGTLDSGFYLACLNGIDIPNNRVNERLASVLEENSMGVDESDMSLSPENDGTYNLGEFCYNSYSGWMYSINGLFANYGMSDYEPIDGDVLQIRFTLAYGADIGGAASMGGWMPEVSTNNASYNAFNTFVAKLIAADFYGKDCTKLDEVLETVTDWDVEQSVVDEATKELKQYYAA